MEERPLLMGFRARLHTTLRLLTKVIYLSEGISILKLPQGLVVNH